MDKYRRVEKPKPTDEPINPNEIRVTTQGKMRNYISYASSLFQEKKESEVVLRAMGRAINKTVTIAEILKRRITGLHQITNIDSTEITDVWEPVEEGLDTIESTRHVSSITIRLSTNPLDNKSIGYQPPLAEDQVKQLTTGGTRGIRRGGRGGRGMRRGGRGFRGYGGGYYRGGYGGENNNRGGYYRGGFRGGYERGGYERGGYERGGYGGGEENPRGRGRGRGGFRGGRGGRGGFRGGRGGRGGFRGGRGVGGRGGGRGTRGGRGGNGRVQPPRFTSRGGRGRGGNNNNAE